MIENKKLNEIIKNIRINIIKSLHAAGSGHPGGSLSSVELLTILYFEEMKRTKDNALDKNRDRFVISKGHGVPTVYAIFKEIGLVNQDEIMTLRKIGSKLQGHPDRVLMPELEASTGSLGQGLSVAQGIALGQKMDKNNSRTYCLVGDGEIQEGQIWETIMSAPHFKLNNLCVILDYNKFQIDGHVNDIMNLESLKDKLNAFNWNVLEIDGHNIEEIRNAYKNFNENNDKPTFIIANTIKGKGVSFMENTHEWHGKTPNDEQKDKALKELISG